MDSEYDDFLNEERENQDPAAPGAKRKRIEKKYGTYIFQLFTSLKTHMWNRIQLIVERPINLTVYQPLSLLKSAMAGCSSFRCISIETFDA